MNQDSPTLQTIDRLAPTRRPDESPIGYQTWEDLLFVHWKFPAAEVQALLPDTVTVDTHDGFAWLGLVPRQFSTGGRTILGRISKRGNGYLRMLLVQAANVILMRPHRWDALGLGPWLRGVKARMPHNKAAVALANKLARTAWSILRHGTTYTVQGDEALGGI